MHPRTQQELFGAAGGRERVSAERARRILEHAAGVQYRRDTARRESYTIDELREMAAEAGISRQALEAAIGRSSGWRARLERCPPVRWSPKTKGLVLAGIAGVLLAGLLAAFPAVAYGLGVTAIALSLLVLLGGFPG